MLGDRIVPAAMRFVELTGNNGAAYAIADALIPPLAGLARRFVRSFERTHVMSLTKLVASLAFVVIAARPAIAQSTQELRVVDHAWSALLAERDVTADPDPALPAPVVLAEIDGGTTIVSSLWIVLLVLGAVVCHKKAADAARRVIDRDPDLAIT